QNAAYEYQRAVDAGEATVVGLNRFVQEQGKAVPIQKIEAHLERQQVERVRALRAKRDAICCKQAIAEVQQAAQSGENLMPKILNAVEAYATVGEISDAMRSVFGEYQETVVI
ncbi:MAG: methylmalonyl-CoA mutase, partial [Acidobacteria bacterium]